jgi:hypothetical protein
MRILTTLLSMFLATAWLGGCAARAKVRVGDAGSTSSTTAPKVAADQNSSKVKAEGQGSAEAPAAQPETETDATDIQAHE